MFADTIGAFGRRLGMEGLAPGASGAVELVFERVGRVQAEVVGGDVVVTLAREWPRHGRRTARALLDACHWRENHPWDLHPGAKGEELAVLAARVPLAEFDLPAFERVIGYLSGVMDKVGEAG